MEDMHKAKNGQEMELGTSIVPEPSEPLWTVSFRVFMGASLGRHDWQYHWSLVINSHAGPSCTLSYPSVISVGSGLSFCSFYSLGLLIEIHASLICTSSPSSSLQPRFLHPKCPTPLFDASLHIRLYRIAFFPWQLDSICYSLPLWIAPQNPEASLPS